MKTNKKREVTLKSSSSFTYFWLILLAVLLPVVKGSALHFAGEKIIYNCTTTGEITASTGPIICSNTPVSLTLTNYSGIISGWLISTDINFDLNQSTFISTNQSTITLQEGLNTDSYIKVVFLSTDISLCPELFSNTFLFQVVNQIEDNIISPSTSSFGCTPASNITINGNAAPVSAGAVSYEWQMSFNATNWMTVASGANSVNLTMVQYPNQSVYFRRLIHSATCLVSISNVVLISYTGASDGGTLIGGGIFCYGEELIQLSLNNYNGTILEWQSSTNGIDFISMGGAGQSTFSIYNLFSTTHFRVAVQQTGCELVYSNTVVAEISQLIENNIISSNQTICLGQIPAPLTGLTPTGGIEGTGFSILWQMQTEGTGYWVNIPVSTIINETLTFTEPLTATTHFQRVVSDAECDYSTSEIVTITVVNPIETISEVEICSGGTYTLPDGTIVDETGSYSILYTAQTTGCDSTSTFNVQIFPATSVGTLSDAGQQQVCFSNSTSPITLSNFSGEIESWYIADNVNGPWTSLNTNVNPITLPAIENTTYLKALVAVPNCENTWSNVYTILVQAPISNNTIGSDQWLCSNTAPQTLSGSIPMGGNGTYSFQWQLSYNLIDWINVAIGGNSFNHNISALTQTTHYRRQVSSGSCVQALSNIVTIQLIPDPTGYLSAPAIACPGLENEITVHLTGTPPFEITFTDGIENFTVNNIIENNFSIFVNATTNVTYTLLGVSDYYCTAQNFTQSSVAISIIPNVEQIDAGMDAYVCGLSHTLYGSTPENDLYNAYWTDLEGNYLITGSTLNTVALTPGPQAYIYFNENAACNISISDTVWVTYDLAETSNAGPNQQICSESTQLAANELEPGQGFWLIPAGLSVSNPFDNNAYIYGLQQGMTYEIHWVAESQFGVCNADTSTVQIAVGNASLAGNLISESEIVCSGTEVQIIAENYFGNIIGWIISSQSATETINSSSSVFESGALTSSTSFQVIVQAGNCTPDTSDVITILVDPPTQAGNLIGNATFCSTDNQGELLMTGLSGSVLWWEISENNFETYTQVYSSQTQYNFEDLLVTTQFRTMVQSGSCPSVYSNIAIIEIGQPQNVDFEIAPAFCSADDILDLSTLLSQGQNGNWTVNGLSTNIFTPSDYAGLDVEITVSAGIGDCFSEASQTVHVFNSPQANAGSDMEACGIDASLVAIPSIGNGIWTAGDEILFNGNNTAASIDILSLAYGTQIITWTETNGHCTSSDQVEVLFWQEPTSANAGEDQNLSFTYSTTLNAESPTVGEGFWSAENMSLQFDNLNDPKTMVRNLQIGENKLNWNVTNGNCEPKSNEIIVFVNPLVIPNGFTPNGDNVNDLYVIEGIETVSPVHITVLNRWGEQVYENTEYKNEWDGRHKNGNDLPEDTYYYSLSTFGLSKKMTGFIVLKR